MFYDSTSCSDCKLELIEKRWTQLLLNWLNKCVTQKSEVTQLNAASLVGVINKYRHDICVDDIDRAILCSEDVEPFIKYKYPILRLRYFAEENDFPKKIYIMTTVLLFHCCISSIDGLVDNDICTKLSKEEQEIILKFCELLTDMEVTSNNIECAIKDACLARPTPKSSILKKTIGDTLTGLSTPSEPHTASEQDSPSDSTLKQSFATAPSDTTVSEPEKKVPILKFKSSVTVLPSVVTDTPSYSSVTSNYTLTAKPDDKLFNKNIRYNVEQTAVNSGVDSNEITRRCQPECACTSCSPEGPCCGDPGISSRNCKDDKHMKFESRFPRCNLPWKICLVLTTLVVLGIIIALVSAPITMTSRKSAAKLTADAVKLVEQVRYSSLQQNSWHCKNGLCQKVYTPTTSTIYKSLSRCILLCMGPQIWPYPIGYTHYSKNIVALATNKLEYKFQSVPSETVHRYLAEAFKLFLGDLARLERIAAEPRNENGTLDLIVKKMNIQIDVETDPDPRMRLDTEESYGLQVEATKSQVIIKITSTSFCGVRHGLETLSQLILLDQDTGYLITLSDIVVKDAPSYKYRGLMIDTGRNYIPVPDLMRTVDAMATCKLNTFHWRISDVTSFPLLLPNMSKLFQYGGYHASMVYTVDDVKAIVNRAGIRGIRVLIEVAVPGPVGRAWLWSKQASCPSKDANYTCSNVLCLRMSMTQQFFDILQHIYSEILKMTKVDDMFHLSDSVFSFANCYNLIEERDGFLVKALERLKLANKGFMPKLPIVWYSTHLNMDFEAKTWDRLGVQLNDWQQHPSDHFLSRNRVIHSSRWDLSCQIKKRRCQKYRTWQEMYSWKSWKNIDVFILEGGEAVLWTDLVDSGNLDYHIWPRAAAVAERLWSDIKINSSASGSVYVRLDIHRWADQSPGAAPVHEHDLRSSHRSPQPYQREESDRYLAASSRRSSVGPATHSQTSRPIT